MKNFIKRFLTWCFIILNSTKVKASIGTGSSVLNCTAKGMYRGWVKIGSNTSLKACTFVFKGRNNKIVIGNNVRLAGVTFWFEDDGNEIIIGDNTTMEGDTQLAACEGTKITIGKDCMFARNVNFRTTDSHSVIDGDGNRINPANNISIGNHVWIGTDVLVLKGTCIPDNCVVSAKALVASHEYEKNSIIGGVPAKHIRLETNWVRKKI